jgi:hypothetical protein
VALIDCTVQHPFRHCFPGRLPLAAHKFLCITHVPSVVPPGDACLRLRALTLLGLNLLLLLDPGLGLFTCYRRYEIISLRQSQPTLRYVREDDPRVAVPKRARHL